MKKRLDFRIQEFKFEIIEEHCKAVGRTKTDVLRELIRSLKVRKSRQAYDRASDSKFLVKVKDWSQQPVEKTIASQIFCPLN
jgi:hypothetical protein